LTIFKILFYILLNKEIKCSLITVLYHATDQYRHW